MHRRRPHRSLVEHRADQVHPPSEAPPPASPDERRLVEALRAGDERAFAELIDRHGASMTRLAMSFVPSRAVAEEVVQETWLAVLQGIDRFEARSSLKTWVFRILVNRAKTRGVRERRSVPFASLGPELDHDEPSVDPSRFLPADHQFPHHWNVFDGLGPRRFEHDPEHRLLDGEAMERLRDAIETLPARQREVIRLRDVEGWDSAEVRNALAISETNQRVLLHRARSKVRAALEEYFDETRAA